MSNIHIKTTEIAGIYSAIHAMRNPKDSWDKSDSKVVGGVYQLGDADLKLAQTLVQAGKEHRKFLRQIHVWADCTMPRYWWQEADTYHFGTKNSCSTMHTLHKEPFALNDFYLGKTTNEMTGRLIENVIDVLNYYREEFLKTNDYSCVIEMKRILPESFIQLRSWDTNYEEIANIYFQRRTHRLTEEWVDVFCKWAESLPYFKELCLLEKG